MIRTLIIDDETHIRDTLTKLLSHHCHQVSVVGEAFGVADGIKAIKSFHPDLVLLDIHMKDGTGFDLLNTFSTIDFKVIFVSSFDKTTIRVFKLSGLEYLMKPFNPLEIMAAVNRVMKTELQNFTLQIEVLGSKIRSITSLE